MPFFARVMHFWKNIFRRREVERDLNDELMAYVEEVTERHVRAGMTADAAREGALLEVGGMDGLKQQIRQQHIGAGGLRRAVTAASLAAFFFSAGVAAALGYIHWRAPRTANTTIQLGSAHAAAPSLEGILLLSNTRHPIANVGVALRTRLFPTQTTTSDEWGRFTFTNPPPGSYRLVVGSADFDIPLPSAYGNDEPDWAAPNNAAYAVYVVSKDGKNVEGQATRIHNKGTIVAEKPAVYPERNIRVYRYSDGRLDIAAMVDGLETGKVQNRRESPLLRDLNYKLKLDNGIPWGRQRAP